MKIVDVICSPGRTGFYFDDQRAIKRGAGHDGVFYTGEPVTEGFTAVRQAGESISVMLVLEDGQIAAGDCAAVQYSGAGGRDPLFLAKDFIPLIDKYIKPELVGKEANDFRGLCAMMESIQIDGKRLHTAIRYGLSQSILDAVAKATGRLMCEVVADEYGCTVSETPVPIFTQSGDDRYDNSDKMIIKGAQVLPHALINNIDTKLGRKGEKLLEYVAWLSNRIQAKRVRPFCTSTSMGRSARPSVTTITRKWPITSPSWRRPPSPSICASRAPWTATATGRHRSRLWRA